MRIKLRFLIALAAAAAVASIVAPAGGVATVSLGPLSPCCFQQLPLHYDAEPGETNDVQILMTLLSDGSLSGTWIVIDNSARESEDRPRPSRAPESRPPQPPAPGVAPGSARLRR